MIEPNPHHTGYAQSIYDDMITSLLDVAAFTGDDPELVRARALRMCRLMAALAQSVAELAGRLEQMQVPEELGAAAAALAAAYLAGTKQAMSEAIDALCAELVPLCTSQLPIKRRTN